jgi:hypothetical protein
MSMSIWARFRAYLTGTSRALRAITHSQRSKLPVASLLVPRTAILTDRLGSADAAAAREGDLRIAAILDHQGLEDERDR